MKSERITVLGSPQFKAYLAQEAGKQGVSISELVRRRCAPTPTEEERLLVAMAAELSRSVAQAKISLSEGLSAVQAVLARGHHQDKAA
jgi:hypothetical protein